MELKVSNAERMAGGSKLEAKNYSLPMGRRGAQLLRNVEVGHKCPYKPFYFICCIIVFLLSFARCKQLARLPCTLRTVYLQLSFGTDFHSLYVW